MTLRILLVDDPPSFRSVARALLERAGFDVVGEPGDARSAAGFRPNSELPAATLTVLTVLVG